MIINIYFLNKLFCSESLLNVRQSIYKVSDLNDNILSTQQVSKLSIKNGNQINV